MQDTSKETDQIKKIDTESKPEGQTKNGIKTSSIYEKYVVAEPRYYEDHSGVYKRLYDVKTHERFVGKCLKKKAMMEPQWSHFESIIPTLLALEHPNIHKLLEVYDTGFEYILVYEDMKGEEIGTFLDQNGNFTEEKAATTIKQLVDAILYYQSKGLSHLNINGNNLMYDTHKKESCTLKFYALENFKLIALDRTYRRRVEYDAPEYILNSPDDIKTDFWGIGCILYLMLSGGFPWSDVDMDEQIEKILGLKYDFVEDEWKEISKEAKDLIKKLFTLEPKDRLDGKQILDHPFIQKYAK